MILQKFLASIDILLSQVKKKSDNNMTVLNGLAIIIIIGDFY